MNRSAAAAGVRAHAAIPHAAALRRLTIPPSLAAVALAVSVAGICGCGSSNGTASLGGVGASSYVSSSTGGAVADSGVASVSIPAQSMSASGQVIISPDTDNLPSSPSGETLLSGTAVSFQTSPTDITFSEQPTVTIDYTSSSLGSLSATTIVVYQLVSGSWVASPSATVNSAAQTVTFQPASLGTFALFASSSSTTTSSTSST